MKHSNAKGVLRYSHPPDCFIIIPRFHLGFWGF